MKNLLKYAFALSAATVFGGAVVAPAQAEIAGSLAFTDGTTDFFSQVNPEDPMDTFSVDFNPMPGEVALVNSASGVFIPPFSPGFNLEGVTQFTGEFAFVSLEPDDMFRYELTNDLVFAFNNGATITWEAGTDFIGMFTDVGVNSVQFNLAPNQAMAKVEGLTEDVVVIADTLQFSDTSVNTPGTYNSQLDVAVGIPEPATLFGLGVVAAGLVTSRRQKNS
ncbi:MAG: PEP-CTERM sorting domain-containing protein [Okeania sp. SIO3H1]|nr:PEP-CTERM sorting domain-containing protein [Okeania sp. SIO3H1]